MNLLRKSIFIFFGVFTIVLLTHLSQILTNFYPDNKSSASPVKSNKRNPVSKCYDSFYAYPKQILSAIDGKYTYYQIVAQPKKAFSKDDIAILYFRTSIYRCEDLSRGSGGTGRLEYMPKAVAIKLAEQWFQPAFDKCLKSKQNKKLARQQCIKDFEKHVNIPPNTNEVSPYFLFTDDAIALNRLGIKTDKALVVDTRADFEKYMSKFRNSPPPSK